MLSNPWIPHTPTPKQGVFLTQPEREALFGGAAGGGKSDALLMAALQYVEWPGYSALILRRSYADLALPDAIMDRAKNWLAGKAALWNEQRKVFTFPSGATLTFGFLEHDNDKYRYQGTAFQFVGFDELTQFTESSYRYLFSRLRRLTGSDVPVRMRGATNPGGPGHEWVLQRFIVDEGQERTFTPSTLDDNPYLDRDEYIKSLSELDPFTRQQLLAGDWFARPPGSKFKREWFKDVLDEPPADVQMVRAWDLAATEPRVGADPDYTCGALVAEKDGVYTVCHMVRERTTPRGVEAIIKQTAINDRDRFPHGVPIRMEQEPGSSGVNTIDHYARDVLKGYDFKGVRSTGSKEVRANPVSSAAEAGNVKLVRGPWVSAFLDEAVSFPGGAHDDMVDALSLAFSELNAGGAFPYGYMADDPRVQAILARR